MRHHFLSRAQVRRILQDVSFSGPSLEQYCGDLQMHSEWSDGAPSVQEIADACVARGNIYAAVTDHSYGLRIAEGNLDLCDDEAATFDVVLAAAHSRLRRPEDQTERMLRAIAHRSVRILAHPRGRITGSRAGVIADWDRVFALAAERAVAIEIDGDPARQDLDHTVASRARDAGCLFALDSDAHTTAQLAYADTALAHARLANIPTDRIVNCWPLDQLLSWLACPANLADPRGGHPRET